MDQCYDLEHAMIPDFFAARNFSSLFIVSSQAETLLIIAAGGLEASRGPKPPAGGLAAPRSPKPPAGGLEAPRGPRPPASRGLRG